MPLPVTDRCIAENGTVMQRCEAVCLGCNVLLEQYHPEHGFAEFLVVSPGPQLNPVMSPIWVNNLSTVPILTLEATAHLRGVSNAER